jgi:lipopolysaccharide transport system ATP-binding protein
MSSNIVISVENLSKSYLMYQRPQDRLRQLVHSSLKKILPIRQKKYYEEFCALKNNTFEVLRGEVVGIIGRNGSGKSTLLQLICGILNPSEGRIITKGRIAALLELGSGFNPEFSGKENIYLNAALLGLSKEEIDQSYQSILAFADIGEFIHQPVKTYSSGMLLRLAFSVIAHVKAEILIIDEALAVGDVFFTQKCMRFLREFMSVGTIFFVSHDTGAIKSFCTKVIWLDKGKILKIGSPKEVCEDYLDEYYAEHQGLASNIDSGKSTLSPAIEVNENYVDQRSTFINNSSLRNDIRVFTFDESSKAFGSGEIKIAGVELIDDLGRSLAWVVGGELVTLKIHAIAVKAHESPIVGFLLKDKLGQYLFGDNTFLSTLERPFFIGAGNQFFASFVFQMPRLASGDYSITVAVATGTQNSHIQQHWIHDALTLKSTSTSVSTGILGIPMKRISLNSAINGNES